MSSSKAQCASALIFELAINSGGAGTDPTFIIVVGETCLDIIGGGGGGGGAGIADIFSLLSLVFLETQ